ncbi:MAG TPA: acyl carrier protein [Clostridia bacterium]|nr:acyl carrier protein [Clostridia bacterium]
MISREYIGETVKKIIIDILQSQGITEFNPGLSLRENGLDSISHVQLIVKLEEAFDIAFEDEDLIQSELNSIELLVDRVLCLKGQKEI